MARFAGGCADAAAGCPDRFNVSSFWRWSRTFCTLMRGLLAPLESSSLNDVFFFDIVRARPRGLRESVADKARERSTDADDDDDAWIRTCKVH